MIRSKRFFYFYGIGEFIIQQTQQLTMKEKRIKKITRICSVKDRRKIVNYLQNDFKNKNFKGGSFWHNMSHILDVTKILVIMIINKKMVGFIQHECHNFLNIQPRIEFIEVVNLKEKRVMVRKWSNGLKIKY